MAEPEDKLRRAARGISQRVLWVVLFFGAFVVVKEVTQRWAAAESFDQAGVAANKAMDDLKAKAAAEHPDKPPALAAQEEALKQSAQTLAQQSGAQKANTAAGQFLGFYLVNVRARHDYCKALGVDISAFTDQFKAQHRELYAKSRLIHDRASPGAAALEVQMAQQLKPTFDKTIQEAMAMTAHESQMTEQELCSAFSMNGGELAAELHLSKVNPGLQQALLEAK